MLSTTTQPASNSALFYQRDTWVELEDTDVDLFLTKLSQRLEAESAFAGQVAPLGARPRVFISYP